VSAVEATSSLTILFVTSMHPSSVFPLRGVIVLRLAEALRALGHRVELFELGVSGGPRRYLKARKGVAAKMETVRPDVVHAVFGYSGLAVPRSRVPLVTSFNGDDLNGTVGSNGRLTLRSRLGILLSQWVAYRSARCIAVSAPLRERLWLPAVRTKTRVIRDAVDTVLFRPFPKNTARKRLGLSPDQVLVIFPHDVAQPTKRVQLAEAAVALLCKRLPQARLWIVNDRPPGDMPWYYAAADVMIVTSVREGGPSSVKEALACGIPVVSVPVGDITLFQEARGAMFRADASPEALAAALYDAVSWGAHTDRRSYLPTGLTLDRAALTVVTLYREVLAQVEA